MKVYKYFIFAFILVVIDQTIKMLVHFYMEPGYYGQVHVIGDFFTLFYTTNDGMAFGALSGVENDPNQTDYFKTVLTLIRLGASVAISIYLYRCFKKGGKPGFLWSVGAVLGGAVGNILDCVFYGVLPFVNNALANKPFKLLNGQVIDMFYIHICDLELPSQWPLVGGYQLSLWPIFNFADACIFCSVIWIIIKNKSYLKENFEVVTVSDQKITMEEPMPLQEGSLDTEEHR